MAPRSTENLLRFQLRAAVPEVDTSRAYVCTRCNVVVAGPESRVLDHLRTRPELAPYRDLAQWRAVLDDGPELLLDGSERRPE